MESLIGSSILNRKHGLSLFDGIGMAVGSIMGSGVLFLPALLIDVSGDFSLYSWIITILLCLPMILMFCDILTLKKNTNGISDLI